MIDPIKLAVKTEEIVCKCENDVIMRKYWRFRGGKWYGGIATADCVGCNLRCKFCGPLFAMLKRGKCPGEFKSPKEVANILYNIAHKRGYRYVRISGGEPTICFDHLIEIIKNFEHHHFIFILETNGILIGANKDYAEELSRFHNVHVRVSLKGTNPSEFEQLTMASGHFFEYQLRALKNLLDAQVSFHPAVVASFTTPTNIKILQKEIAKISDEVADSLEIEYIVLYPHVVESLLRHKLIPKKAYTTDWRLIDEREFRFFIKKL